MCANNSTTPGLVHGVLVKQLIHAFDRCSAKIDFRNVDHLACMEVRKANLTDCEYVTYLWRKDAYFALKRMHAHCVKRTAVEAMMKSKFVEEQVAEEAVERVFKRCYNDLEPYGRRSRNRTDLEMAHAERYLFGYE